MVRVGPAYCGTQKQAFKPVRGEPRNQASDPDGEAAVQNRQRSMAGVGWLLPLRHWTVNDSDQP